MSSEYEENEPSMGGTRRNRTFPTLGSLKPIVTEELAAETVVRVVGDVAEMRKTRELHSSRSERETMRILGKTEENVRTEIQMAYLLLMN